MRFLAVPSLTRIPGDGLVLEAPVIGSVSCEYLRFVNRGFIGSNVGGIVAERSAPFPAFPRISSVAPDGLDTIGISTVVAFIETLIRIKNRVSVVHMRILAGPCLAGASSDGLVLEAPVIGSVSCEYLRFVNRGFIGSNVGGIVTERSA